MNKNKSRAKLYIIKIKIINIVHRANKVMSKDESLLMRPKDSQDDSVHRAQLLLCSFLAPHFSAYGLKICNASLKIRIANVI